MKAKFEKINTKGTWFRVKAALGQANNQVTRESEYHAKEKFTKVHIPRTWCRAQARLGKVCTQRTRESK